MFQSQYQADRQRQPAGQAGVGRTRDERNECGDRPPVRCLTAHTETSATYLLQFWHSRFVSDTPWHGAHEKCGHPLTKNMGSRPGSVRVYEGRPGEHRCEEARVQYAAAAETPAVLPPPTTITTCGYKPHSPGSSSRWKSSTSRSRCPSPPRFWRGSCLPPSASEPLPPPPFYNPAPTTRVSYLSSAAGKTLPPA